MKKKAASLLTKENNFTNAKYIAGVRTIVARGASIHAIKVVIRKNWSIRMFKDSDAPTRDATAIFEMLTGIPSRLHVESAVKIAIIEIVNESGVTSLSGFIFHPSNNNPIIIDTVVKITKFLNLAIPELINPLMNNELLFQLKRRLDRKHKTYTEIKSIRFPKRHRLSYPYL